MTDDRILKIASRIVSEIEAECLPRLDAETIAIGVAAAIFSDSDTDPATAGRTLADAIPMVPRERLQ